MTSKQRRQKIIITFQNYFDVEIKDYRLWKTIQNDFENWRIEKWSSLNFINWDFVKMICLIDEVWINKYDSKSNRQKIMMIFVVIFYDDSCKD